MLLLLTWSPQIAQGGTSLLLDVEAVIEVVLDLELAPLAGTDTQN